MNASICILLNDSHIEPFCYLDCLFSIVISVDLLLLLSLSVYSFVIDGTHGRVVSIVTSFPMRLHVLCCNALFQVISHSLITLKFGESVYSYQV